MLPVSRVLGHKEWTTRKADPVHSMTWRRDRIARFKPHPTVDGAKPAPTPAPPEDDMFSDADRATLARIDKVTGVVLDDPVIFEGVNLAEAQRRLLRGQAAQTAALASLTAAFAKLADAYAEGRDIDAAEIKAAAKEGGLEALAEGAVQVDVRVAGATPAAGA